MATAATVPHGGPSKRFGALDMTRAALLKEYGFNGGVYSRLQGHDISRFRIGTRRYAGVTHPDYIEHIIYKEPDRYYKSPDYQVLTVVMGLSIFGDDGESWRRHRMMLNPMFARRHLNGVFDLMVEPVQAAVADLPNEPAEIEMDELMVDLALDVIGNALFHSSFTSYFPEGTAGLITEALRKALWMSRLVLVADPPEPALQLGWKVFQSGLPLPPPFSDVRTTAHQILDSVDAILADREAHPTDVPDLLNLLLSARDEEGSMTPNRVRSEAVTAMLAGHETTANALLWTWYLLALNGDARDRMLEEVDTVLEGRPPTVDDLDKLVWTTACLEEAMRYYPPVWLVARTAIEDDEIDGHRIAAGTTVWMPVYYIHHDPRWWPDPEVYDPSRFLPGADPDRPRCAYIPFHGGRRVCIGRSFAMMEAVMILAMFSQTHTFDMVPGFAVEPEAHFTFRPRNGLRMIARPRG